MGDLDFNKKIKTILGMNSGKPLGNHHQNIFWLTALPQVLCLQYTTLHIEYIHMTYIYTVYKEDREDDLIGKPCWHQSPPKAYLQIISLESTHN